MSQEFVELLRRGKLVVCGLGQGEDSSWFFEVAREIREANTNIGDMDVVILASALNCPDCEEFYTNDSSILNSTTLRRVAEKYRVRIQDPTTSVSAKPRPS